MSTKRTSIATFIELRFSFCVGFYFVGENYFYHQFKKKKKDKDMRIQLRRDFILPKIAFILPNGATSKP